MDAMSADGFDAMAVALQPWLPRSEAELRRQGEVQAVLAARAGARFGRNAYVAPDARVATERFVLGERSWVASGAIIRGHVEIGDDCSVNAYAHIAGRVTIGRQCRIASLASIYGFNHGIARTDVPIMHQPTTTKGVVLHEDVWVGANAVIMDGVEIGAHCVVAAGAIVTQSFPPYKIIGGNPARVIKDRLPPQPAAPAPAVPTATPSATPRATPARVRDLLYDASPYDTPEMHLAPDMQGWGSTHPVFRDVIAEVLPKLIVEVGTWKGASAIHMAKLCQQMRLPAEIVCVDTWLGNWQHWSRTDGVGSRKDLRMVNGFPHLYYQFLCNVIHAQVQEVITPLPLTGVAGAKLFAHYGLRPDIVYVDGDHEYESVIGDLRGWLALLSPGGVLIGDDILWPGVKRAVEEICATGQWDFTAHGDKFVMRRRG